MVSGQIIDAIIYIYVAYATIIGFRRGFFNVLVGIFGIYGASLLAWLFQDEILQFSINTLGVSQNMSPSIIFIFVWLFFYLVLTVGAKILTELFKLSGISLLLRVSGGIFNGLKAVLIVVVVLTFMTNLNKGLFESTEVTNALTIVGAKAMNFYSDSVDENKVEAIKETAVKKDSFIIDDDFRYNLLEE